MTNIAKIAKITNVTKFYIDVEKGETKKGPEMSGNIAQVTRIFLASWKHLWQISLVTFGNPCLKNYGYCTATFMYNAGILWTVFFSPNLLFLIFWKDRYGGFLAMKSSATTPFYCLKFAPFCERHSFLCIVAVCWWKNEAYTDWYYSILLLSVIINGVTFVTDDFIFAKIERITKLLDKNVSQLR